MLIVDETGRDAAGDLLDANVPTDRETFFGGFDCCRLGNVHCVAGCRFPHLKHNEREIDLKAHKMAPL